MTSPGMSTERNSDCALARSIPPALPVTPERRPINQPLERPAAAAAGSGLRGDAGNERRRRLRVRSTPTDSLRGIRNTLRHPVGLYLSRTEDSAVRQLATRRNVGERRGAQNRRSIRRRIVGILRMSEDALRTDDRPLAHRDRDGTTITDDGVIQHGDAALDAALITHGNTKTEVDVVSDDGIPADAHVLADRHAAADARGRVDLRRRRDGIPGLKTTELLHDALPLGAEIRARERLRRKASLGIVPEVGNARNPMLDPGARLAIEILIGALADVLLDHGAAVEMSPDLLGRKIAADMLHSLRSLSRLDPGPGLAGPVRTIEEDTGLILVQAEKLASNLARSRRVAVLGPHGAGNPGSTFGIELNSQTIEPGDRFGTLDAAEAAARVQV